MIALDTAILIYATNGNEEFESRAQGVVERAVTVGCGLSTLIITEFLANDAGRRKELEGFLFSLPHTTFTECSNAVSLAAADILNKHSSIGSIDAIHLATAVLGGATEFWTNDRRLARVRLGGLKVRLLSEFAA